MSPNTGACVTDCRGVTVANCFSCISASTCSDCLSGFSIAYGGSKCAPTCKSDRCEICEGNATNCVQCLAGFKLVNGSCFDDICSIQYCTVCASISSCLVCSANFGVNPTSGICEPSCIIAQPKCLICSSNSTCRSCESGFKIVATAKPQCQPICSISNC